MLERISWLSHFRDVWPKKQGDELTRCRAGGEISASHNSPDETIHPLAAKVHCQFFCWENSARVSNFCHREPTHSKNWSGQLSMRFGALSIPIFGSVVLFYPPWRLKLNMTFIHEQGNLANAKLGSKPQKSKAKNQ